VRDVTGYRALMRGIEAVVAGYLHLVRDLERLLPGLADVEPGPGPGRRAAELVRASGHLAAQLGEPGPTSGGAEPVSAAAAPTASAARPAAPAEPPDRLPAAPASPERARFLLGQLRACEVIARRLAGQRLPVRDEIEAMFGVRAVPGDPDVYGAAHRELDALLPGSGPLGPRLAASRARVSPDRLPAAVTALAGALREETRTRVPLPPGEGVTFRFVADAPWAALHRYAGSSRSVVTVNAGAGFHAGQLARLVAHETYPGHHAARCHTGVLAAGRAELGVVVAGTPQALVSEGAAEIALHAAVGPGWGRWVQDVLGGVGVAVDGELVERVDAVTAALARARLDALLMVHGDRARDADVRAYLRRVLLVDHARAVRILTFLRHPLWRLATVAYVEGAARVRPWWDADPSGARLARLLGGDLTPADLRPNELSGPQLRTTGGIREATSGRPIC
jgi:hypothetical protein